MMHVLIAVIVSHCPVMRVSSIADMNFNYSNFHVNDKEFWGCLHVMHESCVQTCVWIESSMVRAIYVLLEKIGFRGIHAISHDGVEFRARQVSRKPIVISHCAEYHYHLASQ